jgi:hypothetical protein
MSLDGTNLGPNFTSAPYTVSWNTATAANGCHQLSVIAVDAAGNQASASLLANVSN